MLFRHGFHYLLARGVPGVLNFLAIAVYTRLLDPDEYGAYTLTIAAVSAADALLLQWLRLALLRFLPKAEAEGNPDLVLAALLRQFLGLAAVIAAFGTLFAWFLLPDGLSRQLVLLGLGIFVVQGLFELTVERERSALSPRRYGLYAGVKSLVGLTTGAALALVGWGAAGLLVGLLLSMMLPLLAFGGVPMWVRVARTPFDGRLARQLTRYGLPLAATSALAFVVSSSDRFMLAGFIDQAAAGRYAAGYDLAQFTLGMLLNIVNLAAYPLIVTALDAQGETAARGLLRWTARLLLGVGLPVTVGLAVLSQNVATVMVGPGFRDAATVVIPWIALAALIAGFKAFYLDLAFQLGKSTITQVWIALITAVLNVILNLLWIPRFGILGAVYATVAAHCVALLLSWWLGRRAFPVPLPGPANLPILGAALVMGAVLSFVRDWVGAGALVAQVLIGVAVFAASLLVLDRRFFAKLLAQES